MSTPPLQSPALCWQDGQPYSPTYGDSYYSRHNGLAETRHVFLAHNHLAARWATHPHSRPFVIAETGFGTGLNFLATWALWQDCAPPGLRLHVISTEAHPLSAADLQAALALWLELAPYATALLAAWPPPSPVCHRLLFANGQLVLDLWLGDACDTFTALPDQLGGVVDAWYLDGFAPAKNPALWSPALFAQMARLSRPQATFSTYTAASAVRHGLSQAGFNVRKAPGFPPKREMLCGTWPAEQSPVLRTPPWFRGPPPAPQRAAIIIGGGLAGTATAASLSRRGWDCTLVDSAPALASGASGNRYGIIHPQLSQRWDHPSRFSLTAWLYARQHYAHLRAAGATLHGAECGTLLLACHAAEAARLATLPTDLGLPPALISWLDAPAASQHSGQTVPHGGLWLPTTGWLSPVELCQAQWQSAAQVGARLLLNTPISRLQHGPQGWTLYQAQRAVAQAPLVILANAADALRLLPKAALPIQALRGQVTYLPASAASTALSCVLCYGGYLTPAIAGAHGLGATYAADTAQAPDFTADNQENLEKLAQAFPDLATQFPPSALTHAAWRSSLRCSSLDHLPILGALPDQAAFQEAYADLHHGKRWGVYPAQPHYQGLYVNLAHGSRGLVSTPLAAELLAAQLEGEPLPLSLAVWQSVCAQRFWVRKLKIRGNA